LRDPCIDKPCPAQRMAPEVLRGHSFYQVLVPRPCKVDKVAFSDVQPLKLTVAGLPLDISASYQKSPIMPLPKTLRLKFGQR
jgi:hypothetical protein